MEKNNNNQKSEKEKSLPVPTVSAVLSDGALLEMVYDPSLKHTAFVYWQDDSWIQKGELNINPQQRLVPYSADNNLIKNEVVLFPSTPVEYETEAGLLTQVQQFIHRYVDVSPLYEKIASYYVLLSWVYDAFNELPYLRLRADPGSGKTRFLLTVGSLCYKPIFASGASTVSPLFRIIDAFRGTLIIDEGDFRLSDEQAEVVKILNNGNARGFPVLRSEVTPKREYNPTAYTVFGPKLVATRSYFQDRALESRCITEEMGQGKLRDDIPINLPFSYKSEALEIRNKLLLFRFRTFHKKVPVEGLIDRAIEPRLNQVFIPLLSVIDDAQAREELQQLAREINKEFISERGMDTEAQILDVIHHLIKSSEGKLSIKEITSLFADRHQDEYERKITAKWVGSIIRKKLHLKPYKSGGVYVISPDEAHKLERLYERYDIRPKENEQEAGEEPVAES